MQHRHRHVLRPSFPSLASLMSLLACTGEHEHTIVGYSLVKGIGDGEPIASERFSVGGHEWVSASMTPMSNRTHLSQTEAHSDNLSA